MTQIKHSEQAHVVAVDMGYGHERAAYALRDLAPGKKITIANNYPGISKHDRGLWSRGRTFYETVSRLQPAPVVGEALFDLFLDNFQRIDPFYPRRDLSRRTLQVRQMYKQIRKDGHGKDLIEKLKENPLPLVSTFFQPAFAAEEFDYPGEIYLVACDADISRAWAPWDPKKSRIKYFAPNGRVVERLKLYGVREENIFLTGFPLPKELVGGPSGAIVKRDLLGRLGNLDPRGVFWSRHGHAVQAQIGHGARPRKTHPLSLAFAVGGAGAQKTVALQALQSLRPRIKRGEIRVALVAGARKEVADYFTKGVRAADLGSEIGKGISILYAPTRRDYFTNFSKMIRTTDILWTKPSELSFYTGLGIPIIMAEPIGSQEDFNRKWIFATGGGTDALAPDNINEWLFDWIGNGALARMAWNGFIEAPTHGAYRIEEIVTGRPYKLEKLPLIV